MKHQHSTILLVGLFVFGGLAYADGNQKRDSSRRNRSTAKRTSRGHRDSASRGSVRYHRSDRDSGASRRSTTKRSDRSPSDRTTSRVRSSSRTSTVRRSTYDDRSYPPQVRYHARSGSIRNYRRSYDRPTHWPSHRVDYDVRVRRYPRYGTHITQLPLQHRVISHRGHRYYYCDGVYYRPYGGVYRVVRPPIGFTLSYLPAGYTVVYFGGQPYYRYENTYYVYEVVDDEPAYVVVQPPEQVIVDYLPPDCREVYYRGRLYYVDIYEETAYAPVIVDGYTRYRLTDLDVDVDFDDGRIEIEIDD